MAGKQPKLILRESCVNDMSRHWPQGSFLEMGAGTGHMTRIFLQRGFHGACYDLGDESRQRIRHNLKEFGARIRVLDDASELTGEQFDYLLAFEVLEHIDEDESALCSWAEHVKPGGRVLLSVPAHSRKYGRSDELVGHVRRYEKAQLHALLAEAGFEDIRIVNYGFPITELTRRVSNALVKRDRSYDDLGPTERSILSAQSQPRRIQKLLGLFSGKLVAPFCVVQRWFYARDLGDGYVATGTLPVR